jgi:hypothetical protein
MKEEMSPNSKWAQDDQFKPDMTRPDEEIKCLHCGGNFRMREMVFESRFPGDPPIWWCPNRECDGRGFGWDLHTVRDYFGEFLDGADAQD